MNHIPVLNQDMCCHRFLDYFTAGSKLPKFGSTAGDSELLTNYKPVRILKDAFVIYKNTPFPACAWRQTTKTLKSSRYLNRILSYLLYARHCCIYVEFLYCPEHRSCQGVSRKIWFPHDKGADKRKTLYLLTTGLHELGLPFVFHA